MKAAPLKKTLSFTLLLTLWLAGSEGFPASASPKAQQEVRAKGYIFETSHDEIVAKAKKEGKVRVLTGLDPEAFKPMTEAFKKKYPFLDVYVEELTGQEAAQRFLLELKAGVATGWDVINFFGDFFPEFLPHSKKFDILGMAEQGVLSIPIGMVDPFNRSLVVPASSLIVVGYNKSLVSQERIPETWEGFLQPELSGRKFIVDIKAIIADMAACPEHGMGLEWLLGYAKKLAAQKPVWARGTTGIVRMAAGEYPMHGGYYLHTIARHQRKDLKGDLAYKIIEPVPAHLSAPDGVVHSASHPYAGLLWLEFQAGPEGQRIIDSGEPGKASLFSPTSLAGKALKGKKSCVVKWQDFSKLSEWRNKVIAAFGFPRDEIRK